MSREEMRVSLPTYGLGGTKKKFKPHGKYRPFAINYAGGAETNKPVKCTISSEEIPFHLLRPDGKDIVFLDKQGNLLPYWIETKNSTLMQVWLKFPEASKSFLPVYMYYNNLQDVKLSHISAAFKYKRKITISEQSGDDLTDYQVLIELNSINFDFEHAQTNGEDVRFTDANGNLLPYWIEEWDSVNEKAKVWVKVPSIPANGTVEIWMYYGNSQLANESKGVNTFPEFWDGSFFEIYAPNASEPKISGNYLAENMEYDPDTGKYWIVFTNRATDPWSIGLAYADSPDGPWTIDDSFSISSGDPTNDYDAPCLKKFGDYWYIYYEGTAEKKIYYRKSASVNGEYGSEVEVLAPSESYDAYRTGEPYIFYNPKDNLYYLFYMAMPDSTKEWTCYATSSSPEGPFTKHTGNPVIGDPADNWNRGGVRAADPFVFEKDGVFYIGVAANTASGTDPPWRVGFYKTQDFETFTKVLGYPSLDLGPAGSFDEKAAWRGAVTKVGDKYYLVYTGQDNANNRGMAITTLQFDVVLQNRIDEEKFLCYGSYSVSEGVLYVDAWSSNRVGTADTFGVNYALRAKVKMVGSASKRGVVAFRDVTNPSSEASTLQFISNLNTAYKISAYQKDGGAWKSVQNIADTDVWQILEIRRLENGHGRYMVDDVEKAYIDNVADLDRNALFSYCYVDWFLVRKYTEPEPSVSLGAEETA